MGTFLTTIQLNVASASLTGLRGDHHFCQPPRYANVEADYVGTDYQYLSLPQAQIASVAVAYDREKVRAEAEVPVPARPHSPTPPFSYAPVPNDDHLVTVARYDATGEAQLAKTQLEDADIPCMVANEDQSGLTTLFEATKGRVHVKVPEDRAEEARAVLDLDADA